MKNLCQCKYTAICCRKTPPPPSSRVVRKPRVATASPMGGGLGSPGRLLVTAPNRCRCVRWGVKGRRQAFGGLDRRRAGLVGAWWNCPWPSASLTKESRCLLLDSSFHLPGSNCQEEEVIQLTQMQFKPWKSNRDLVIKKKKVVLEWHTRLPYTGLWIPCDEKGRVPGSVARCRWVEV